MKQLFAVIASLVAFPAAGVFSPEPACGAEVDLAFKSGIDYYHFVDHRILTVNVGDTVRWTLQDITPNITQSYDGLWDSGLLITNGASVSYTFTNAGLFPYHAGTFDAVVNVLPWTNQPPPITINDPFDGLLLPKAALGIEPLASVSAQETNVVKVTFFTNAIVAAVITNPPYTYLWPTPTNGDVTMTAELTRGDGSTALSAPVHFSVGNTGTVYNPHILPDGSMLIFYRTDPHFRAGYLQFKETLTEKSWAVVTALPIGYGVVVDTSAATVPRRFYRVAWGELPPP